MPAEDALHSDQFQVEEQGSSPLLYNRRFTGLGPQRVGAAHPDVTANEIPSRRLQSEESIRHQDYWHPKVEVGRTKTGRPLKAPKVVDNPSAAKPGTASFVDFEETPASSVYIHYANTREGYRGQGLASKLVSHVADKYPEHDLDFGKVMSPHIWKIKESLEAKGRTTRGHRDF